jgi:hypothetical protein
MVGVVDHVGLALGRRLKRGMNARRFRRTRLADAKTRHHSRDRQAHRAQRREVFLLIGVLLHFAPSMFCPFDPPVPTMRTKRIQAGVPGGNRAETKIFVMVSPRLRQARHTA